MITPPDFSIILKTLQYDPANPLLFNSGFFLYFFTAFLFGYTLLRKHPVAQRNLFCAFSLYFFYKASGFFVSVVIISAVFNYWLSLTISKTSNKTARQWLLVLNIVFNLGILVYFKYTNFFITLSNELLHAGISPLNILLPVGISFFTFENLSYTVDVYKGQIAPAKRFGDYLLFLTFFPKLVMGPIVRADDFLPQVSKQTLVDQENFSRGFYLILTGLFKKMVISDYLTVNYVNFIFDEPSRYTGLENLAAVYAYAMVIYCDFSGYSDVAIGIARWLGFSIPANFAAPYQSRNITEFWRRWHISLSSWLRDYLYIPLGGNKGSKRIVYVICTVTLLLIAAAITPAAVRKQLWFPATTGVLLLFMLVTLFSKKLRRQIGTYANLLATMLLGGLWHGASINFLIWGALHGIGLIVHKLWLKLWKTHKDAKSGGVWNIVNGFVCFQFVCLCWVFFRCADLDTAFSMLKQITTKFDLRVAGEFANHYKNVLTVLLLAFVLQMLPQEMAEIIIAKLKGMHLVFYVLIFVAFILLYSFFKSAEPILPIYLQF